MHNANNDNARRLMFKGHCSPLMPDDCAEYGSFSLDGPDDVDELRPRPLARDLPCSDNDAAVDSHRRILSE
jgi:hypothetical protein